MASEGVVTSIEPTLIQRLVAGLRYTVSGVNPDNWFGPQNPLAPQAQDKTEGRAFDYPVGVNLRIQPRATENVSFGTLRAFADGYDLLRLIIETRKDQIEAFDWEIVPARKEDNADAMKEDIKTVTEFLQSPDKEHDWPQWLRMQLEDLLVIDAIAVYPRLNRGGGLYGFELVDAATIKRIIDENGRTPLAPNPAYQQVLKGIPANDLTRDQLVYRMRNPRTNRLYGLSPVEQSMMTINIAMRRQLSQLDIYTQGNIPEAIAQVPETWSPKAVAEFQTWWDSVLEGNSSAKRKMRFIPRLEGIVFPKDAIIKDEFDEWLARILCFAFSISPSALIKQVNRASGEQMADTAKEEGLMPLLKFLNSHMTLLIQRYLKKPDLRFQFKVINKIDPKTQADIHGVYIDKQVMTPDEVREDLDLDAMDEAAREAAFPKPADPFAEVGPDGKPLPPKLGPDGKPIKPAFGAKPGEAPGAADHLPDAKKKVEPTEAEKMLATALAMLDPARVAEVIAKVQIDTIRAQPATVVEHRPEINVEVGDTTVHVPAPRPEPVAKAAPAEPQPDHRMNKVVVGTRRADGTMVAEWRDRAQLALVVNENTGETKLQEMPDATT